MVRKAVPLPPEMVKPASPPAPPLPKSTLTEAFEVIAEVKVVKERVSNVSRAYALLDNFTPEQKAELYLWLAEHPLPKIDPIRLAIASFHSLKEEELPLFFEQMKESLDQDIWEILTNE